MSRQPYPLLSGSDKSYPATLSQLRERVAKCRERASPLKINYCNYKYKFKFNKASNQNFALNCRP
jgi:hypothetical protein